MLEDTSEIKITSESTEKRGSWYLLTGLVLGLALGLVYSWLINPVVYVNTEPASLDPHYKNIYRLVIAQAYASTGNIRRAQNRMDLLAEKDPVMSLGAQAQTALANNEIEEARVLALLASALGDTSVNQNGIIDIPPPSPTATATIETVPTQTLPHPSPTPSDPTSINP